MGWDKSLAENCRGNAYFYTRADKNYFSYPILCFYVVLLMIADQIKGWGRFSNVCYLEISYIKRKTVAGKNFTRHRKNTCNFFKKNKRH